MIKTDCRWLSNDPWLTEILGKPCYWLDLNDAWSNDANPSKSELEVGDNLVYAKVPTDSISSIHWLEGAGFKLVDTNVTLQKKILPLSWSPGLKEINIRFANPEDRNGVVAVAGKAFSKSRFHMDPKIPEITADKVKALWAENFFLGQRGEAMVIAEGDGEILGFLQLLHRDDTLTIDLIATDASTRGKGIGRAMVSYAEKSISGFQEILTGTQLANSDSLKFYQSLGFQFQQAAYVFHRHNQT